MPPQSSTDRIEKQVHLESGFDKLPAARRAEAFEMNSGGWASQLENIKRHLAT